MRTAALGLVAVAISLTAAALPTAADARADRPSWSLAQARAFTTARVPAGHVFLDCYGSKRVRPAVWRQRPGRYARFTCVAWYDGPCARELRFRVVDRNRAKIHYRSPYTCPSVIDERI